jgi:hypothetical protein
MHEVTTATPHASETTGQVIITMLYPQETGDAGGERLELTGPSGLVSGTIGAVGIVRNSGLDIARP